MYLHFLNDLFAKRANLCGAGDGHVLRALVLTAHSIKSPSFVLNVAVQVSLWSNEIVALILNLISHTVKDFYNREIYSRTNE